MYEYNGYKTTLNPRTCIQYISVICNIQCALQTNNKMKLLICIASLIVLAAGMPTAPCDQPMEDLTVYDTAAKLSEAQVEAEDKAREAEDKAREEAELAAQAAELVNLEAAAVAPIEGIPETPEPTAVAYDDAAEKAEEAKLAAEQVALDEAEKMRDAVEKVKDEEDRLRLASEQIFIDQADHSRDVIDRVNELGENAFWSDVDKKWMFVDALSNGNVMVAPQAILPETHDALFRYAPFTNQQQIASTGAFLQESMGGALTNPSLIQTAQVAQNLMIQEPAKESIVSQTVEQIHPSAAYFKPAVSTIQYITAPAKTIVESHPTTTLFKQPRVGGIYNGLRLAEPSMSLASSLYGYTGLPMPQAGLGYIFGETATTKTEEGKHEDCGRLIKYEKMPITMGNIPMAATYYQF